jgi:hypothetical protein
MEAMLEVVLFGTHMSSGLVRHSGMKTLNILNPSGNFTYHQV